MLNILQHYQKYNKQCGGNNQATSPTQLCQHRANLNPKYRQYTNCSLNNPGQKGSPSQSTSQPQQFVKQQHKNNDQWIGVM